MYLYICNAKKYHPELLLNVVSPSGTTIGKHFSPKLAFNASLVQQLSWSNSGSGVRVRSWSRNCPTKTSRRVLYKSVRRTMWNQLSGYMQLEFYKLKGDLTSAFGLLIPVWNSLLTLRGFGSKAFPALFRQWCRGNSFMGLLPLQIWTIDPALYQLYNICRNTCFY